MYLFTFNDKIIIEFELLINMKFFRRESNVYYIDIVGNYGENLIAVGQEYTVFILDPAHNLSIKA